jgi:thymidylate synthase (FAD)
MASACIEIETTRDIAHQIVRHRSFSFQEFSQRYANPQDMESPFEVRECRFQDPKNRQNSISYPDKKDYWEVDAIHKKWSQYQKEVIQKSKEAYDWAINAGIAKEQARSVLPEGCTKSTLMMNGTIRSWVHYVDLRSANGTQKEHADIAKECGVLIANIFPLMLGLQEKT